MTLFFMIGKLDPDERVLEEATFQDRVLREVTELYKRLGWEPGDEVEVKLGGTVVSGIEQPPEANKRWSLPFGERRYNGDAFIVIQNHSRRDFTKSEPLQQDVLSSEFVADDSGQLFKARKSSLLPKPTRVVRPRVRKRDAVGSWLRRTLSGRE